MKFEFTQACSDLGWICWLDAHPGLAAWAQMIGVVVTLIGALIAAQLPLWHARKQQQRDRRDRLHTALTGFAMMGGNFTKWRGQLTAAMEKGAPAFYIPSALAELSLIQTDFIDLTAIVRHDPLASAPLTMARRTLNDLERLFRASGTSIRGVAAGSLRNQLQKADQEIDALARYMIHLRNGGRLHITDYERQYPVEKPAAVEE